MFDDPVQLVSASVPAVASVVILAAVLRSPALRPGQGRRAVAWRAYALALAAAPVLEPSSLYSRALVSSALVGAAAMSSIPQVTHVLRSRDRSGVSVVAWAISALSSAAWVAHGVLGGFAAVIVANLVWLAASVAVVIATLRPHKERMSSQ